MTRIYTRAGDAGETALWGGQRVGKDAPRVEAYGAVDEAMCAVAAAAAALPRGSGFGPLRRALERVQAELFEAGAVLAAPEAQALGPLAGGPGPDAVARLEAEIDAWTRELGPLKTFILPGGSLPGALLHVARAVCRRAEREAVALSRAEKVPASIIVYLNRLSDHLFVAARWTNRRLRSPETPWKGRP